MKRLLAISVCLVMLLVLLAAPAIAQPVRASVAISGFSHVKSLRLDTTAAGAGVLTAQHDFPVCIEVSEDSWPSAVERSHFFALENVGGKRVEFYDSTGSIPLAYEIEKYDAARQDAVYWVKVPTVAGNSNTNAILVAYGNDPNGVDQDHGTAVWDSSYVGVWHFGASGANSTSLSGLDMSRYGCTYIADSGLGGGYFLDGVDDFLRVAPNVALNPSHITLFAVAKSLSYEWGSNANLVNKAYTAHVAPAYQYTLNADSQDEAGLNRAWSSYFTTGGSVHFVTMARSEMVFPPDSQQFTDVAMTYDGTAGRMYESGNVGAESTPATGSLAAYDTPLDVGRYTNLDGPVYYGSYEIAELRLSNVARSSDWIKMEHASVDFDVWPGDGWLTWGAEDGSPTSITIKRSAVSVRYPTPFILSGVLSGGRAGDPCVAEVRKPGSSRWSYSSARIAYSSPSAAANWWYRYSPKLRGTYTFRARFAGDIARRPCLSGNLAVAVR